MIEVSTVQVLVVQDHTLLGTAIARILDSEPDITVVGIARTGADAAVIAARERASVVLMDFHLPDMSGPAAVAAIRAVLPDVPVVFHTAEESDAALLDAIDVGAKAFLTKSATPDQIVEAVRRASKGEVLMPVSLYTKAIARHRTSLSAQREPKRVAEPFTGRELEILNLLANGLGTAAMSHRLGIAANTIEWHVSHVIDKLGVHSKLQAVITAARMGLIKLGTQ